MKRLLAVVITASLVTLCGCGHSYKERLARTLTRMEYLQTLDRFLNAPEAKPFSDLGVYVRAPKPLTAAQQPGLNAPAGHYDALVTFLDLGGGGAAQDKEKQAESPAAPLRLHVLVRVNRPKTAAKKKGEEAPAEPATPRGQFVDDVRNLLASDLGGQDALSAALQNDKKRSNDFKRLMFTASNGDAIKVYFYKAGEYDVALVWDIPPGQEKSPAMVSGAEYAMGALATGPRAKAAFAGNDADDTIVAPAGEAGPAGVPGQPF